MRSYVIASATFVFLSAGMAAAQDYGAMLQQYMQQDRALTQQMQQTESAIVRRNMQDPRIQAMYQQHRMAGGTMSFEQFAYSYAATAGFTPDGMRRYNQNEQAIQQREQQAIQQYRQNQAQNAEVFRQRQEQSDRFAKQRGNVLSGTNDFRDPSTGAQFNLPYNQQPGTGFYDPGSGQGFYQDPYNSSFYRQDPNGYDYELEEED